MATATFIYNSLQMKTLKERIKTQRKIVSHFKLNKSNAVSIGTMPLNHIFLYAQWAYFGSQGIVVKCTAAIFFLTVDYLYIHTYILLADTAFWCW